LKVQKQGLASLTSQVDCPFDGAAAHVHRLLAGDREGIVKVDNPGGHFSSQLPVSLKPQDRFVKILYDL
jgi:hypothetical protein